MKPVSRALLAAAFALVSSSLAGTAEAACANCKPAARTIVKTTYNVRNVQRVNNVTRYRTVNKTNNVYVVRDVQRVRLVQVSYVMRDMGTKRVSKSEYDRVNRNAHRTVARAVVKHAVKAPVKAAVRAPAKRVIMPKKRVAGMEDLGPTARANASSPLAFAVLPPTAAPTWVPASMRFNRSEAR